MTEDVLSTLSLLLVAALIACFVTSLLRVPEILVLLATGAAFGPHALLVLPGVVVTAVVTGLMAHLVFDLSFTGAVLLGAVLAPTDPAILIPQRHEVGHAGREHAHLILVLAVHGQPEPFHVSDDQPGQERAEVAAERRRWGR